MVEKDTIFSEKVKHKGLFSFSDVYKFSYNHLIDEGYFVVESNYSEKITPTGKDVDIEWEAKKKISDYFKFTLKIKWQILGMKEVEAEQNGTKVTMNKGSVEIKLKAILEKDYENRWEDRPFFKFLRGIYDKYIIKSRIDEYEGKLFGEGDEFLAQVKSFLALEGKR
ncbi:MAG: hypothetical protein ABIG37_01280, partial [Nanoarchaeota archaeon]|nr:hypothetical protein [Nanoarchaeota archaeon]MBU1136359.1 hypothetical protein [Nanoarchaeota archaeon]